jgi:hypothetical protein
MDRRQAVELLVALALVVAAVPLATGAKNAGRGRSSPCNTVQSISVAEPIKGPPPKLESEAKPEFGAHHPVPAPAGMGCGGGNHQIPPWRSTIELGPFTLHHRLYSESMYGIFGNAVTTIGAAPECAEGRLVMPREEICGHEPNDLVLRRAGDGYLLQWSDYSTWRSMLIRIVPQAHGPQVSLFSRLGAPLVCLFAGLVLFLVARRLRVGERTKRGIIVVSLLTLALGDVWLLQRRNEELARVEHDEV